MDFEEVNPYSYSPVLRAVQLEDIDALQTLLARGHSPDSIDNRGLTPLHLIVKLNTAVPENCARMMSILLDAKADINFRAHNGITPVSLCIHQKREDLLKILLARGADPNIGDMENVKPLHVACMIGSVNSAILLLQHGANVDVQDFNGYTPLHEAVINDSFEISQVLLQHNANVLIKDRYGHTPLHLLPETSNKELISLVINNTASEYIDCTNCDGLTLLMLAAQNGNGFVINELIARQTNPNITSNDGILALHFASGTADCGDVFIPILRCTNRDTIENVCQFNMQTCLSKLEEGTHDYVNSITCLLVETGSKLNLNAFFHEKFSLSVYDCPVVVKVKNHHAYMNPIAFLLRLKTNVFKKGTLNFLNMLLKQGLSVNPPQEIGCNVVILSALSAILGAHYKYAIKSSLVLEIMDVLVKAGADVDALYKGYPLTMIVCKSGYTQGLDFLLAHSKVAEPSLIINDIRRRIYSKDTEFNWNSKFGKTLTRMIRYVMKFGNNDKMYNSIIRFKNACERKGVQFPKEAFGNCGSFSLQSICRTTIRKQIRDVGRFNVYSVIGQLGIPETLKEYLSYSSPACSFHKDFDE